MRNPNDIIYQVGSLFRFHPTGDYAMALGQAETKSNWSEADFVKKNVEKFQTKMLERLGKRSGPWVQEMKKVHNTC